MTLTHDQIETFGTDGVLVVEDVLPDRLLERVRAEYRLRLEALYEGWRKGDPSLPAVTAFESQILNAYNAGYDWFQPLDISLPADRITPRTPMHLGPAVFDMLTSPEVLDIVEVLIGPEITSNPIQHVRIKPPERTLASDEVRAHVGGTDWHQDRGVAHQEADRTDMITVWIAITDATEENGCLVVAPERPAALLPHCPQRQTAIARGFVDADAGVPLPVRAGGIVLLHPLTPHASLPNRSNGLRWSFDLRYNKTGQPTGRAHFPEFVARSAQDPASELKDWRQLHAMWMEARTRLSDAPHIDLHRWQADSPVCA